MQPFEHPFSLQSDDYKLKVKHNLHNRRYTSDTDPHPEATHGSTQVQYGGLLLPEIDSREQLAPIAPHANSKPNLEHQWKSNAVLKALDKIKKDEVAKVQGGANEQVSAHNIMDVLGKPNRVNSQSPRGNVVPHLRVAPLRG